MNVKKDLEKQIRDYCYRLNINLNFKFTGIEEGIIYRIQEVYGNDIYITAIKANGSIIYRF